MKTKKILPFILFLISIHSFAQHSDKDKKEQIKTLKVGFLTNELALTTDEAAKFWPVYNEYDDKQFELRHEKMKVFMNKLKDSEIDKMSDKEAKSFLAQMESNENEISQLREKFNSDIKRILSPVKILKLKKAEVDFNKKLLQQYRNKGSKGPKG